MLTFVWSIQDRPAERLVMRVYPSGYAVAQRGGRSASPLDLIGLTQEKVDPIAFGFEEVETSDPDGSLARDVIEALRVGRAQVRQAGVGGRRLFLLYPSR